MSQIFGRGAIAERSERDGPPGGRSLPIVTPRPQTNRALQKLQLRRPRSYPCRVARRVARNRGECGGLRDLCGETVAGDIVIDTEEAAEG